MIFKYEVEIEVDEENISRKYPNYKFNYSNPKELADSIAYGLEREGETNMATDGLNEWGYSIKVKDISKH
jgi:hypothetical protein